MATVDQLDYLLSRIHIWWCREINWGYALLMKDNKPEAAVQDY